MGAPGISSGWSSQAPFRSSLWLFAQHKGDDANAQQIHCSDPRFLPTLGKIGESMVQGFCRPAVHEAFDCWLENFVPKWDEIEGIKGGKFLLQDELTLPLFMSVVRSMRKGKAVGAGGLSSELLNQASNEVLETLYTAIMHDASTRAAVGGLAAGAVRAATERGSQ